MSIVQPIAILTHFKKLRDPRVRRTRKHHLLEIITIALCATLCGANSWADVERFGKSKRKWFARFLKLPGGIPSHDTLGRVFARLDTEAFGRCVRSWLTDWHGALTGQDVAIDGKTLRGSFDRASGQSPLHLVSAWATGLRLSLGQVAVEDKSNEITAVPKLLELLELTGAVVTLDAMHCQQATAAAVVERQADYVMTVKANQRSLYRMIQQTFEAYGEQDFKARGLRTQKKTERCHGRVERREYYVAPLPAALAKTNRWAGAKSIAMVYRRRESGLRETDEVHYYLSSLPPKVGRLARAIRGHWGIENTLHWSLDVTFAEDQSRLRRGNGPEIAGALRRLALSILQQDTSCPGSLRGKRLQAGWNNDILAKILTGFSAK